MKQWIWYLIVINILAFILYGIDKKRARDHAWRISERMLIGIALIGGSVGAMIHIGVVSGELGDLRGNVVVRPGKGHAFDFHTGALLIARHVHRLDATVALLIIESGMLEVESGIQEDDGHPLTSIGLRADIPLLTIDFG